MTHESTARGARIEKKYGADTVTPFDINFLEISRKVDGARSETISGNLTQASRNLGQGQRTENTRPQQHARQQVCTMHVAL